MCFTCPGESTSLVLVGKGGSQVALADDLGGNSASADGFSGYALGGGGNSATAVGFGGKSLGGGFPSGGAAASFSKRVDRRPAAVARRPR